MSLGVSLRVGKIRSGTVKAQIADLNAAVTSIFDQIAGASPYLALDALQPTFKKSQEYCPKKTGALVDSGYLEITSLDSRNPRVEMGYGLGGSPPYAVYVHEQVNFFHAPPTRAKWLQAAMLEDLQALWARLITNYREFTGPVY
jgi:hypothetical protein